MPLIDFQTLVKTHGGDKQVELLKEVEQVFDQAGALEKSKTANAELTKQREDWEKEKAANKTALETLGTEKKSLEAKLAEAQKGTPDQAVLNGLNDKIAALQKKTEEAEAREAQAKQQKLESDLNSTVISAAGKAVNPNQVLALMKAEGRVGIKKEDGTHFFYKFNEKREPVALKPEEAVSEFLKENPHLEKGSGTQGTGTKPDKPGTQVQTGLLENPEGYLK